MTSPRVFAGHWTYSRAAVLFANGRAAEAAPLFEAKPDYLPALIKAGDAWLAAGDASKAAQAYRKALKAAPNDASAHYGLGRATNKPAEFEKALASFPDYGAAMFALAQSLQRSGDAARAKDLLARYEKVKTTAPPLDDPLLDAVADLNESPTALVRKGQSAAARGDLASAIALHEKAIQLDPKMTQAAVNLISLYARANQPGKAEDAYRKAIASDPNLAEAHYNYGVFLQSVRGDQAQAKAQFELTLTLDPAHAAAHHNLGAILQQQGQLAAAQRQFESAIEFDPSSRNSRFQLGRLYANAGRTADAIAQFEKIVTVDDDQTPTYLYALGATMARAGDAAKARGLLQDARNKAAARSQGQLVEAIDRDLSRLVR